MLIISKRYGVEEEKRPRRISNRLIFRMNRLETWGSYCRTSPWRIAATEKMHGSLHVKSQALFPNLFLLARFKFALRRNGKRVKRVADDSYADGAEVERDRVKTLLCCMALASGTRTIRRLLDEANERRAARR